jgi:PAS domain S-box-containing protein
LPAHGGARGVEDLGALYRLTDRLYRAQTEDAIFEASIDAICATLRSGRSSILLFDEAGAIRFVAWRGLSERYREAVTGHSPWRKGEQNAEPIYIPDIESADLGDEIRRSVRSEGIRSLAFIPITSRGGVVGKFMVYYGAPHQYDAQKREVAITIARQLGFALERVASEAARLVTETRLRESEARFRLMSENAPVMIWICDPAGACVHLNRMLRAFWAVGEQDMKSFDWRVTIHPDDIARIGAAMGGALARREPVTVCGRYLNAKGEYRSLQTTARPHFAALGEFRGLIGVNVDVTEREQAQQALRESEERFRLAVEAAPSGMLMTDSHGRIVLFNSNAEEIFGYDREEILGQGMDVLLPERFRAAHPVFRAQYFADPSARPMGAQRDLYARRKDGSEIPVEIGLSPIETTDGLMAIASVVDISRRKRGEAVRDLLMAELDHRVKNTLAVVQGIAHQTFKQSDRERRALFEGRLQALSAAHSILTRARWESAPLEHVVRDTIRIEPTRENRIAVCGENVLLPAKQALAIGLAVHELFTNAVKYGALSNETGRIEIDWRLASPARRLNFSWKETGGPPVASPTRQGFGTLRLNQMLVDDLDSEVSLDFDPKGVSCSIAFALESDL